MSGSNKKLFQGIQEQSIVKVQQALNQGANPNGMKNNVSPLFLAVWQQHPQIVELLCQRGANVNFRQPQTGETPLHIAVSGAQLEIVQILCQYGADASIPDSVYGRTPRDLIEEGDIFDQIETILETCGLTDPNAAVARSNGANLPVGDPQAYVPNENTDPQGGKRKTRRRHSSRKHRKSSSRSKRG